MMENLPDHIQRVWQLAWPVMLRQLLFTAAGRFVLALVGHYDDDGAQFDGAAMGTVFSNISGLSIGMGLNLGLSIFCSQAHGAGEGALRNPVYLRRCLLVLLVAFVLVTAPMHLASDSLLRAAAQTPAVSQDSARFVRVQLIGVPFYWVGLALISVCDAVQRPHVGLWANMVSAVVQVVTCVVCVDPRMLGGRFGYLGMAVGRVAGGIALLATTVFLVRRAGLQTLVWRLKHEPFQQLPVLSTYGLKEYLAHTLPAAMVWWVEWWGFEGLALLVGTLPQAEVQLGANGVIFNSVVTLYQIFSGLGTALCALVGEQVGGSRPLASVYFVRAAMVLAAIFVVILSVGLWALRAPLARLFTSDEAVQHAVGQSMVGASVSLVGYGFLMTLYGACRGAARQKSAALATALGYCAVGIPLAYFLGKVHGWPPGNALLGIWLGNASALVFAAVWVARVVATLNWAGVEHQLSKLLIDDEQKLLPVK